jgi:hypothetical protein
MKLTTGTKVQLLIRCQCHEFFFFVADGVAKQAALNFTNIFVPKSEQLLRTQ